MSFINRLGLGPQAHGDNTGLIVAGTAIATATLLSLLRSYLWPTPPKIVSSPLRSVLPKLSQDEFDKLEYKPDNFPGARDVETPYGSIRVYEWGPLTGDKVVFVHGISTSCITLTKLANALVDEKGCRVMLFDLFGRGYSDNPSDLPHDARLYTSQILIALVSSPDLAWTGPQAFRLIGYSLGGGIAVHFAASFPHLVSSLVLLAPAGLIRPESFGVLTRAVFTSGLVPPRLLAWITRHRLKRPIRSSGKRGTTTTPPPHPNAATTTTTTTTTHKKPDPITASLSETTPLLSDPPTTNTPPSETEADTTLERLVLRTVQWQLTHHAGFIPAFLSTLRHAPMLHQHAAWRKLALRAPGTTAIILGEGDEIIDPVEYAADALPLVGGRERVRWAVVPGGHDFPMTFDREVLGEVYKAWGWEEPH
ncbi:Alpha/Beta hydrolase protein [Parachaetomium inaequale]|uniref:Alpha/Beta hydrolase protein n=1 Tax=Parachaetomium inaequale TaxID=2588326 RepID=A0AAN6PM55_9PEZI|nr:Alpha/Beta hydrolase protein [Parachaetomium inaequale]